MSVFLIWELFFFDSPKRHSDMLAHVDRDELYSSISIEGSMYSSKGNPVGFSYEMLQTFGEKCSSAVNVTVPVPFPACWDSLVAGNLDIVVLYGDDAVLPEHYKDKIFFSVPMKNDIVFAVVAKNSGLLNTINLWLHSYMHGRQYGLAVNRYFRTYRLEHIVNASETVPSISPYDEIIRKYSRFVGIDWKLMTALIYQESRFYMRAQSGKSAKGLVQMKESTARKYGVDDLYDPELSIKAGTLHLKYLFDMFIKEDGVDTLNAMKFALASYNAGENRIIECRRHAAETGHNAAVWDSVAATFGTMPGFTGRQTVAYVDNVMSIWEQYKNVDVK